MAHEELEGRQTSAETVEHSIETQPHQQPLPHEDVGGRQTPAAEQQGQATTPSSSTEWVQVASGGHHQRPSDGWKTVLADNRQLRQQKPQQVVLTPMVEASVNQMD